MKKVNKEVKEFTIITCEDMDYELDYDTDWFTWLQTFHYDLKHCENIEDLKPLIKQLESVMKKNHIKPI